MTDFIIMREQLEYHVRTFCADYLNFRRRKYDGSDEWIKRRLLGYAQICRDLSSKTGLRENAKHAYNFIHAFAGFMVTDEILRLLELRMELGDRKYPIVDVQEAKGWGRFAILFKEDVGGELIAQEESSVYLRGYVEATGYQTIVPLGYQLYKRKDLVLSES